MWRNKEDTTTDVRRDRDSDWTNRGLFTLYLYPTIISRISTSFSSMDFMDMMMMMMEESCVTGDGTERKTKA